MIWYVIAIVFGLVLLARRALRPHIAVTFVNGAWLATVTGVFSKREYVRTSANRPRQTFSNWCDWWHDTTHGHALSWAYSIRADNLVTAYVALKPVRDYAGGA